MFEKVKKLHRTKKQANSTQVFLKQTHVKNLFIALLLKYCFGHIR